MVVMAALVAGPVAAQTFTLPELGLQSSGTCQQMAVRNRSNRTMVPFGCVDTAANLFRLSGNAETTVVGGQSLLNALAAKAPIDANGNVSTIRGVKSSSDETNAFKIVPFWAAFPSLDVIHYTNHINRTTTLDGAAWDSPLGIDYLVTTGYKKNFVSNASVALGDNIIAQPTGATEAYVYRVTQAGTVASSASSWGAPGSAEFTSGTAKLIWINYNNLAVKIGFTNTTFVKGEGGATWLNNFNMHLLPMNHQPQYMTNTEWDLNNDSGYDCALFSGNTCNALNVFVGGGNKSTVGLNISSQNTNNFALEWGIWLAGNKLAADAAFEINTSSKVAIGVGRYPGILGTSTFSDSTYRDESASPVGQKLAGTYSSAAVDFQGATITAQGGSPTAVVRAPGQQDCYAGFNVCQRFDTGLNQFAIRWSGADVLYLDGSGNLRLAGGASPAASTVAALPACNATTRDQIRVATDVTTATYNASVSGGGATRIPVYCNGTAWTAH